MLHIDQKDKMKTKNYTKSIIKVKDRIKEAFFNAEMVNVEVINKVYMLRFLEY